MNFDDEQLLVQKAAFERDLPSENEHGNFCEKASFECTDCLFTGCLFTGCLFTRCLFTGCLLTACLFTDWLFTDCMFDGCHFPRCLFIGCLLPRSFPNSHISFQNPQGSFLDFKEPSLLGCFAGIIKMRCSKMINSERKMKNDI